MKKPDLAIEIPAKYRDQLDARTDPKNAVKLVRFETEGYFVIEIPCVLCTDFHERACEGCPFFGKFGGMGAIISRESAFRPCACSYWINKVLRPRRPVLSLNENSLCWHRQDDRLARRQLKRLRERAEKLIKWI